MTINGKRLDDDTFVIPPYSMEEVFIEFMHIVNSNCEERGFAPLISRKIHNYITIKRERLIGVFHNTG